MKILMAQLLFFSLLMANLSLLAYTYNVPAIFVFGDSIFDSGNNHFNKNSTVQADFPPYGFNFFHRPTGRFTNGRTVADFISQFLDLELQKPYAQVVSEFRNGSRKDFPSSGLNFASAGSGVLPGTNKNLGVTPLKIQVQQFEALIQQNQIDRNLIQSSLFLLESGSNDIFTYFNPFESPKLTPNAYIQSMLAQVQSFISQIYELGARHIAIFSLGPVGCTPARALLPQAPLKKCYGRMNRITKDYNSGLENLVNEVPLKYPGALCVYGDVYTAFQQFLATPGRYGFSEVSRACCGNGPLGGTIQCGKEGYKLCANPSHYLFWDYFHPSEHAYHLIAKALWRGRRRRIRPINLKRLASLRPSHSIFHNHH